MIIHRTITAGRVMAALESDDYVGFCAECDAHAVYGAEEYLFMGVE